MLLESYEIILGVSLEKFPNIFTNNIFCLGAVHENKWFSKLKFKYVLLCNLKKIILFYILIYIFSWLNVQTG